MCLLHRMLHDWRTVTLHRRTTMHDLSSALGAPILIQSHRSQPGSSQESLGSEFSRVGVVGTLLSAGVGQTAR